VRRCARCWLSKQYLLYGFRQICDMEMRLIMRLFLLAILLPANIYAAEFVLDGKKVVSTVNVRTVSCGKFSIVIEEEKFPREYEMRIPKEFPIKGFYGGDFIIAANAYFVTKDVKYKLPFASDVKGLKERLRKATYIPTETECTKDGFLVRYWSGGNGRGADAGINFSVSESGMVSAPLWFNESEFINLYAKPGRMGGA
jgi:hypothetical protein